MFPLTSVWFRALLVAVLAVGAPGLASGQQVALSRAKLLIDSITDAGQGRYRIKGEALDSLGGAACALVLASGKCVFSCDPPSPKCEGGVSWLPKGSFELSDLPVEPDGSIEIQVFIEGLISHWEKRFPRPSQVARWGVYNNVCCGSGGGRFSATIGGVTKSSGLSACAGGSVPSWEGYAPIAAGTRQIAARYTSPCGTVEHPPFSFSFDPGACYVLFHNVGQQLFVIVSPTDCQRPQ